MKQILIATLALGLTVSPAIAQDDTSEVDEGFSLLEEGARMLLRGLMTEMEPAIDDLRGMVDDMEPALRQMVTEMGPALTALLEKVDDFRNYEQPEFMPNGDIIIRRRPDAPLYETAPDIGIEL